MQPLLPVSWRASPIALVLIVHVFSVVAVVVHIVFVVARHVFTVLRHHVQKLQFVARVLIEVFVDDALFIENKLHGLDGHP